MKLNILHPEKQSLQFVSQAIENDEVLYRSPHVGNVNGEELGLVFGLSAVGAKIQLELVDTIRGSDSYSQPKVAIVGLQKVTLASNKHAGRVVGSCQAKPEGVEQLSSLGVDVPETITDLKQLHVDSLRQALPGNIKATPSTEFFAQIGNEAYEVVLREAVKTIDRPLRCVQSTGKIDQVIDNIDFSNIYGLGSKSQEGLLPPLEAMMAIEVIKQLLENEGDDSRLIHIAGPDMIKYTKDSSIMKPVENIINRVLSDLGMSGSICCDYVVPCMGKILHSDSFDPIVEEKTMSQYDLLVSRQSAGSQL